MSRLLQFAGALAIVLRASCATIGPPMNPSEPGTPHTPDTAATPALRDLGKGQLELGRVTLDKLRRTVTIPVVVNQSAGPVEYAVVTPGGKVHESIFRTPAEPRDLHVALLLLGARPANTNRFDPDPALALPGETVTIGVEWKRHGRNIHLSLAECVRVIDPPGRLSEGPWVYNGSFVVDGLFAAQQTGSIVALQEDPAALINNPRPGRFNDELHHVNSKALPPRNTVASLVICLPARLAARPAGGPAESARRIAQPLRHAVPSFDAPPLTP